jgi:hypothetical protein
MADFQTIAAAILEEDGIIAMPFVVTRAFDVSGSCPDDDLIQPVNLAVAISPKCDPALVGYMPRRLGDTKNSVAPSAPAASNCSQPSILTLRVNPSAGSIAS